MPLPTATNLPHHNQPIPGDWRRPQDTIPRHIAWDDQLGCHSIQPRPTTTEEVEQFYKLDRYYTHTIESSSQKREKELKDLLVTIAWRLDHGRSQIDPQWLKRYRQEPILDILDIGAGNGRLLSTFRHTSHRLCGIDPDPQARAIAKQNNITIFPGTAEQLPHQLHGHQFDLILMLHVLEHCLDPQRALHQAKKRLKPNGLIVVETPNNAALGAHLSGPCWRWLDLPRHLNFFTPTTLAHTITHAGFQVQQREFRGYTRQFSREWVEEEQKIWQIFSDRLNRPITPRPSWWRAFKLLCLTCWQRPEKKYDSVRIIARNTSETP